MDGSNGRLIESGGFTLVLQGDQFSGLAAFSVSRSAPFASRPAAIVPWSVFHCGQAGIHYEPAGIHREPAGIHCEPAGIHREPAGIHRESARVNCESASGHRAMFSRSLRAGQRSL